ncbi:MAG: cyclic nucleotide-binding domain-containing protein, partial [Lentisphaeraceae bacterium]|nr:cyclic nucleotide-binding domain-containing protein [Lentisphaeraceae bacterium]
MLDSVKRINEGDVIEIEPFSIEVLSIEVKADTGPSFSEGGDQEDDSFGEVIEESDVDKILGVGQKSDPNNLMHIALVEAKVNNKEKKLREIIKKDTRIVTFKKNEVIIREGDYGTTAFYMLKGSSRVVIEKLSDQALQRQRPEKKSFMTAFSQLWSNSKEAEARDLSKSLHYNNDMSATHGESGESHSVFLQDVPGILQNYQTHLLPQGEVFGEVSAISRSPRGATIYAEEDCTLVEMRWQALREIRRITPTFKDKIDENYRERCLKTHLLLTDLFKDLPTEVIDEITAKAQFFTYGNFEWHNDFKKITKESSEDRIKNEPLIVEEGTYVNGLYLIRAGFARVSRIENHGHFTHKYIGKGGVFGLDELMQNFKSDSKTSYKTSLRSIGYTEIIYIPSYLIFDKVFTKGSNEVKGRLEKIETIKEDS